MESSGKRFKKGELLFRENEPIQIIYVIQSGKISLQVERTGKRLEILTAGPGQVLGEQALFYNARYPFTAEVLQECKLMEVPVEFIKQQANSAAAVIKVLLKSLVDDIKQTRQILRSTKMETDKTPCPQVSIPRIFALLNLVSRHTGKINPDHKHEILVDWSVLKLYTTRMFAESPQRMRSLLDLLMKLKICELTLEKTEEGNEELSKIRLLNLPLIEDFSEFYQYNLYKGSYAEVIHVDTLALKVAMALVQASEGVELDRKGAVALNWDTTIEIIRKKYSIELKNTHLDILEKKGLFVKRQSQENGPAILSFDRSEFVKMVHFWSLIREIDLWNEKGFVDLNEKTSEEECPCSLRPHQLERKLG
ncbi:MAG: cyclic nucleotide-binding domain-containing protein [Bdellovibrionales bacterium]|nr:cyclic nucleotide-binding domain-containing protein [Bdellovibrionales bacterium]